MEHLLTVAQLGQMRIALVGRMRTESIAYRRALRTERMATASLAGANIVLMKEARDVLDALLDGSGSSARISLVEGEN